ncbi:glycerate kinase type-2 family protein [Marinomonas ostreistagni]|uniref:glycerate kinase type-2 family protein n=1 Tax=Marinomonas ostreistagni TaxID=359209 RepID=UPI00194F0612|nr:glycerate kinase [Marinomonas ostreistagni]MBM6551896.1 glycerate kinase [Marinomonas ostreistagni]
MTSSMTAHTQLLHSLFEAALDVCQPAHCVPKHMPQPCSGRTIVIGAGRAAAAMAQAIEQHWPDASLSGTVITESGYGRPCQSINVIEVSSQFPDRRNLAASQTILDQVSQLEACDQVIVLLSGGGSLLMSLPVDDLSITESLHIQQTLQQRGASVAELHTVRRHLSKINGGRLAAACYPAKVTSLLISDVPGNAISAIASGPTVGDPTTCADALAILDSYAITLSPNIRRQLSYNQFESIKPQDPRLQHCHTQLIATPQMALEAAAKRAHELGIKCLILSDSLEGEAKDMGTMMAGIARQIRYHEQPIKPPCVVLSGGNATVSAAQQGVTGPNVEYLLALALALQDVPGISAIACDSDGLDGNGEAGAIINEYSLSEAKEKGLRALEYLTRHDAHTFFSSIGQAVATGPTFTDISDFRAVFIDER